MLDRQGVTGVVPRCSGTHLLRARLQGLPISPFVRGAVGAPAAPEEISVVAEDTEVSARSRGAHDFLGRLEEKDQWWDTNGSGTQAGILCSTASVAAKKTSSTDSQGREKETHSRGSGLFACEESHRACQRPEHRILLKSVSGKKVRRWSQTGDQSQKAELLHKEEDVQDVHHQIRLSEYPQRRLGLHNRLERCLPPCAHCKGSQKVHNVNLADCDAVSGERNQINCPPRRLPCAGMQQAGVVQTYQHGSGYFGPGWIPEESQKMSPHTQTEIRLSGSSVVFQGASCLSHPGQDLRFPQAWFKLAEEPYPESGSEVSGKGDLFQTSCATGTSTPKSSADGSDIRSTFGPLFFEQRGQGISREVVNSSSVEMDKRSPSVAMTTEASNSGWGATLGSRSASGRWSAAESKLHINHLELLAVLKAVHCFTCHLRMKTIVLQLDNVTATSYLNKEGGTRSAARNSHSGYSEVLPESLHNFNSGLPSGSGKSGSGCPLKGSGFKGMVLEPQCGGEDFQDIKETSGGSVRLQEIYSSPHLLLSGEEKSAGFNALDQDWNFRRMYTFPPPQLISLILASLRGCRGGQHGFRNFSSCRWFLPFVFQIVPTH